MGVTDGRTDTGRQHVLRLRIAIIERFIRDHIMDHFLKKQFIH